MKRNPRQTKKAARSVRLSRIARADLGPDDILVVRTGVDGGEHAMEGVSKVLGCKVLILPADARLDVVRNAHPPMRAVEWKSPEVGIPDWCVRPMAVAQGEG